jgi:hypothetical protein
MLQLQHRKHLSSRVQLQLHQNLRSLQTLLWMRSSSNVWCGLAANGSSRQVMLTEQQQRLAGVLQASGESRMTQQGALPASLSMLHMLLV